MKNQNNIYTVTLVAIAFAFAPVLEAGQHLEGGPDPAPAALGRTSGSGYHCPQHRQCHPGKNRFIRPGARAWESD